MSESPEVIRQQMEETKLQLSDKLDSLEHQVTETVQSTGTAVSATVGAVQETVESVAGAVQDAVQSVSNAFDLRRQIDKHPLLVIGGAIAVGFVAAELFSAPTSRRGRESTGLVFPPANGAEPRNGTPASRPPASNPASSFSGGQSALSSYWDQLTTAVCGPIMEKVQDLASRVVPKMIDELTESLLGSLASGFDAAGNQTSVPKPTDSPETERPVQFATADRMRLGN